MSFNTYDAPPARDLDLLLRPVCERDWPAIMALECASYEPGRRDSEDYLRRGAGLGLGLVACDRTSGALLGFCFGGPIEAYRDTPGPAEDERQGCRDTFFSADCTVAAAARGRGIGRSLKRAQLTWAQEHGFRFVTGRNRLGKTDAMLAINRSFGALPVAQIDRGEGIDEYYRITLNARSELPSPP